jgi:hypothetical protein
MNVAERIFCVIIMFVGSIVFGTLLAEVQEMHHQYVYDDVTYVYDDVTYVYDDVT